MHEKRNTSDQVPSFLGSLHHSRLTPRGKKHGRGLPLSVPFPSWGLPAMADGFQEEEAWKLETKAWQYHLRDLMQPDLHDSTGLSCLLLLLLFNSSYPMKISGILLKSINYFMHWDTITQLCYNLFPYEILTEDITQDGYNCKYLSIG